MICKGTTHNNGTKLAAYMTTSKKEERAELWELRGFEATNIKDAFRDVQIMAAATKCRQPFFHVQIRNREGETLTRQQWEQAADRIERMLGLTGQPRAISFHTYKHNNDEHMHVAWSRIDQETLRAKELPYFKFRLKEISRELEAHFGLETVVNQREGNIGFAPTRAEEEQARRLGMNIHEMRNTIRSCFDRSDGGTSFRAALEHEGLTLAQGERRDFVVVDQAGGIHALGKRILDVTAAKIRDRLSDISREQLPTVEMARASIQQLGQGEQREQKVESVWDRDKSDRAWQEAITNAAIEKEKAERQFAESGLSGKQGGSAENGSGSREKASPLGPLATDGVTSSPQYQFEGAARESTSYQDSVAPPQELNGEDIVPADSATGEDVSSVLKATGVVDRAASRIVGSLLAGLCDVVESVVAPKLTPEQIRQGEIASKERRAEADRAIDFTQFTDQMAHQRRQQEQILEAGRQREREGRER